MWRLSVVMVIAACSPDSSRPARPDDAGALVDVGEIDVGLFADAMTTDVSVPDAASSDSFVRDANGPDGLCASVQLEARVATPNVVIVVDQSSSMTQDFGDRNRWTALRTALVGTSGVVTRLEHRVRFALATYTSRRDTCPWLPVVVPPALNNLHAIEDVYTAHTPWGRTPTGPAIDTALAMLAPEFDDHSTVLILATDGDPNICGDTGPSEAGQTAALSSVQQAWDNSIQTYVLSVGVDTVAADHLSNIADIGVGAPLGTGSPYWTAGDQAGLEAALNEIVGDALSCSIDLVGEIDPDLACTGSVLLNGRLLECGVEWRATAPDQIELLGDACEEVRASSEAFVDARFPCDVVLI